MGVYILSTIIPADGSLSDVVDCRGGILEAVQLLGSGWDAAGLSFREAIQEGDPLGESVDSAGDPYALPLTIGEVAHVPVSWGIGVGRLQVRSGTTASPVVQAAARTLRLRLRVL